jgi:hypothetical protein
MDGGGGAAATASAPAADDDAVVPPASAAATTAAAPASFPPDLSKFRLAPEEVEALLKARGCDIDALLVALVRPAAAFARPPISDYHVGCARARGGGGDRC